MSGDVTLRNPKKLSEALTGTTKVVNVESFRPPFIAVINTVDAGKKIELSVDGGTSYFLLSYATSHANQLLVSVTHPVTHIKFTGAIADVWSIR